MKKLAVLALAGALMLGTAASSSAANAQRGGVMGFVAGCCFGIRSGAAYNDGKEVHWREWIMLVPIANIVCAVWTGVETMNGKTTKEYATQYGTAYY